MMSTKLIDHRYCLADVLKSILSGTYTLKKDSFLRISQKENRFLYLVNKGILKITATSEEGRETILHVVQEGNIFNEMSLFGQSENNEDIAIALEDAEVHFYEVEKIREYMITHPDVFLEMNTILGARFKQTENRLLSVTFKNARTRVTDYLIQFVKEFGSATEQGYFVKNFLTNEDFAKLTGTCRQTVNVVFNDLRDQQHISYNNEEIVIPYSSQLTKKM
jgi:CRP/FNR family cyclic AMP-dependent transcriptional regulator